MEEKIFEFCEKFNLGIVKGEVSPVSGGLLHSMYRVETGTGVYAIKVLNREVMLRPTALQNMINSEKIAHALDGVVPLVAAKEFDGKHVVEFENSWFMVFDWLEGTSVFAPEITVGHCAKMGELLGKIHASDVEVEGMEPEEEVRDVFAWEKQDGSDAMASFKAFLPELLALDAEVVRALKISSSHQVISHRDLDPKNMIWQGNQPYIIDWEAAGYVNPYQELAEVLNYWITDADGSYSFVKFEAVMRQYAAGMNITSVEWDTVLLCSFDGMLGWLEYNVRRAAGILGNSEEDRKEGERQVIETITEIKKQRAQMIQLRRWLDEFR